MPSKKFILLRLREIEKEITILKEEIKEHYGETCFDDYLDLTKSPEQPEGDGLGAGNLSKRSVVQSPSPSGDAKIQRELIDKIINNALLKFNYSNINYSCHEIRLYLDTELRKELKLSLIGEEK